MTCVFCQRDIWNANVLDTHNFRVRIGLGLAAAGHCMIITKEHLKCMAEIPESQEEEFFDISSSVFNTISGKFSKPFIVEYGIFGQSVSHAHTHFIPSQSFIYPFIDIEKIINLICTKYNLTVENTDFKGLKKIYKEDGRYIRFKQGSQSLVIRIQKDENLKEIYKELSYRHFIIKYNGTSITQDWQIMSELEKKIDETTREETRKLFKNFHTNLI